MARKASNKVVDKFDLSVGTVKVPVTVYENTHSSNETETPESFGFFHYDNIKIELFGSTPLSLKASSLFHEALHAASYLYSLNLDEDQISKLEYIIPALLRDNWNQFKLLIGE